MKQIIVLIAMVILGLFIAGVVFDFKDAASDIGASTVDRIQKFKTLTA